MSAAPGKLVILSGPSGAGKSTVVRRVLAEQPRPLRLSVSATTRPPRTGERNGADYFFLSREEFERRRQAGEFLECKEVFGRGDWYGTLRSEVTPYLAAGQWVILEIDVEGARAAVREHPDAITIFLHPGSLEELERRLRTRGTEREEAVQRRLEVARRELSVADWYRHQVVNDDLDQAVRRIGELLKGSGE